MTRWDREEIDDDGPQQADLDELGEDGQTDTEPCPSCGADIYESADRCPACGDWILSRADVRSIKPWWWIVLAALAAAMLLLWAIT